MSPRHTLLLTSLCSFLFIRSEADTLASEPAFELEPYVLVADRLATPTSIKSREFARWLKNDQLGIIEFDTGHDLSEELSSYSGVSSYRVTPNRIAHPTTQGMSIRNIGANASSRTLVTYDGIPQNDPFGGWIYWHRFPTGSLSNVVISPSGGGETWGNLGSGGAISLISKRPADPTGRISISGGDQGTYSAALGLSQSLGDSAAIDLHAKHFETNGDWILHPDQRGPIDEKAGSTADVLRARIRGNLGKWTLSLNGDYFDEERYNGTPLGRNETEAYDFSFTASHARSNTGPRFSAAAYYQQRDFANVFTAVSDERDSERAALDQFDVPAEAAGTTLSYYLPQDDGGYLLVGADYRQVTGDVNERFRNLGSGFTRLRAAGGEQAFLGLFVSRNQILDTANSLSYGLRLDRADTSNGFRREWNLETDALIRDQDFADSNETEYSAELGWQHELNDTQRLRLKAFTGFRAPTLNELYRPFRVKNDIIEANPNLVNERLMGLDASFSAQLDPQSDLSLSAFFYETSDFVANAVLSTEAGFDPLCGFVPSGGSCGQRLNIDQGEVFGAELNYNHRLNDKWSLAIEGTYARTRISRFAELPTVEGNSMPQSPKLRGSVRLDYRHDELWTFWIRSRSWSHSYEDLGNNRKVPGSHQFDLAARYAFNEKTALSLRMDNLTDEEIPSGLSTAGLVSIAPGRSTWISWDQRF